ncbi:hypothetical protein ACHAWF_015265 [Thalassiosira exigua]
MNAREEWPVAKLPLIFHLPFASHNCGSTSPFFQLDFGRYLPDRGPKGWQLWAGATTLILYGFYQLGQSNKARVQQKMQERKVRYALAPLMQAEADREYMERELANLRREAEIMKDVVDEKGRPWVPGSSQYNGGQWMPRRIGHFMPKWG